MQTKKDAEALAASMIAVGKEMGVEVHAVLNPMSEPTGRAVGNVLEVIEAIESLEGGGPADLRTITLDLAEKIAGVSRETLEKRLDDGSARRKFDDLVAAQGGNPADLPRLGEIHRAPIIRELLAPMTGRIEKVDAGWIGQAGLQLGAGRARATDGVDFAVGFDQLVKTGESIHAGHPICRIHARNTADFDMAESMVAKAVRISPH
jgi:thymidine phosphorylase